MNLRRYFDRVVVINLKSRQDRLVRLTKALGACRWPFKQPEVCEAVNGSVVPRPKNWRNGPGAWGCTLSHQKVLTEAIRDGVRQLLVLEDDACFVASFKGQVKKFLSIVPDDWDQLMLGGQHWNMHGEPILIQPGVVRCTDCERTHAYAIRGRFMRELLERWQGGGKFGGMGHCDWIMGRDPEMQLAHKVYAPELFLVGQERCASDVYGSVMPRKFWNPPGPEKLVINLHAPPAVVSALRQFGFFTGYIHARINGTDRELLRLFHETEKKSAARVKRLGDWIKVMQWELAADDGFVCTISHPQATSNLVKAASLWKVIEITAKDVDSALKQLPPRLRRTMARQPPMRQRSSQNWLAV